jgi:hypothetical protein
VLQQSLCIRNLLTIERWKYHTAKCVDLAVYFSRSQNYGSPSFLSYPLSSKFIQGSSLN